MTEKRELPPVVELLNTAMKQANDIIQEVHRLAAEHNMVVSIEDEIVLRRNGEKIAEYHYWHEMLEYLGGAN